MLIYQSHEQMRDEIRSLLYLAKISNRSLIIPNVLGNDAIETVPQYKGRKLWPGFRVMAERKKGPNLGIPILEPAFYWRIARDYSNAGVIPPPYVVRFTENVPISEVENTLLHDENTRAHTRVVLDVVLDKAMHSHHMNLGDRDVRVSLWAEDSVGSYASYADEELTYAPVPLISEGRKMLGITDLSLNSQIVASIRPCKGMFEKMRGNRSCFDKCD
jgi:hypothetical protein